MEKKIFGLKSVIMVCLLAPILMLIMYYVDIDNEKNVYWFIGMLSVVMLIYAMFFFNFVKVYENIISLNYFNPFRKNISIEFIEIESIEIKHHPLRWSFESIVILKKNGSKNELFLKGAFNDACKLYKLLKEKNINVISGGLQKRNPWDKDYYKG